jgi:hypothetical protein
LKWQQERDAERNTNRVTLMAWPQAPEIWGPRPAEGEPVLLGKRYEISIEIVNEGERIEYVKRVCLETRDRSGGRDVGVMCGISPGLPAQPLGAMAVMKGRAPLTPEELALPAVVVVAYLTSGSADYVVDRDDELLATCGPDPGDDITGR